MKLKRTLLLLAGLVVVLLAPIVLLLSRSSRPPKSIASVALGDGRILHVEAVTYGNTHRVGNARSEIIRRLGSVLPRRWLARFEPKFPLNVIGPLNEPALVIWVNATSEKFGTNVDCQSIRVELVDESGQHFEEATRSWFGGSDFWRVGHIFEVYPRTAANFTMEVATWKQNQTNRLQFSNPHIVQPESWTGVPLPQQKSIGDLAVVLKELRLRTNGDPPKYWTTRLVFWEPVWELRRGTEKASGWSKPEWFAEDPTGNHGQHLGTNQPVLRFSATFYPTATNTSVAQLLATLPPIAATNFSSTNWWNQTAQYDGGAITVLGFFPHGSYVFSEGVLLTNPPVHMGPVRGGAPSGWTGQTVSAGPLKDIHYAGFYSISNDIVFVSAPKLDDKFHLALRLRDEQGDFHVAKLDSAGSADGIYPFLVHLSTNVQQITPELVLLKPVEAQFTVAVPGRLNP